jgi:serine/threonine-protein kinase
LAAITVAAVAVAMYFVADWFARPIRMLRDAMAEIAQGRYDVRIAQTRRDEYGELFAGFDDMAQALQRRAEPQTPATSAAAGAASPQAPEATAPMAQRLSVTAAEPVSGDGAPASGS